MSDTYVRKPVLMNGRKRVRELERKDERYVRKPVLMNGRKLMGKDSEKKLTFLCNMNNSSDVEMMNCFGTTYYLLSPEHDVNCS